MVASARTLQASESPISIGWFQKNEKSIPTVKICFFGIFLGMAIYIYIDTVWKLNHLLWWLEIDGS